LQNADRRATRAVRQAGGHAAMMSVVNENEIRAALAN
jgi:hypothetical protein